MTVTAEGLVRNASTLYSLPTIYAALDQKINDPLSNLNDIATILLDDSALSARLLRLVNSAMYSFPSKVDTISRAITIIGTKQLRDLALATSVIAMFDGLEESGVDMNSFWEHSIAVGIAARTLATYQNEPNVERFYLMGLLHDIGRVIMFIQIPQVMSESIDHCEKTHTLLYEHENETLGFEHGEVGMRLLSSWQLPVPIVEAVGYHHHPLRSRSYMRESSVVHIADIISNGIQLGSSSGMEMVPKLNEKSWESLGLSSALMPDILEHIEMQYRDAVEIFLS